VLKFSLVVAAGLILSGCVPNTQLCDAIGPQADCAPQARAKFLEDGFNLKVTHTRYQWIADMNEMFRVCRNSIHVLADQVAVYKGKQIEPIDNDKIAMDYDRNYTAGTSTCVATYPVAYKK